MNNNLQSICSALRFLSILPIPDRWCGGNERFKDSANWYPIAGLILGLIAASADRLLCWLLPTAVASALLLLFLVALTGALHLDGLADTADAFFSGRERERMLEIMKDSCAGPMGVTAIVLLLLLKYVLLISIPIDWRFSTLVLMPLCGRSSFAFITSRQSYARPQGGTGAFSQERNKPLRMKLAWGVVACCSILLLGFASGLINTLALASLSLLLGRYYQRKLGGYTGDTLGAAIEITELVPAVVVIFLCFHGVL